MLLFLCKKLRNKGKDGYIYIMKEIINEEDININNGRIRNVKIKYMGTEENIDMFLKILIMDRLTNNITLTSN